MCSGVLVSVLLVTAVPARGGGGQPTDPYELQARLEAQVHKRTVRARDLPSALATVGGEFRIPMVIEWIEEPEGNDVEASVPVGTVGDLIRAVVDSRPGYGLENSNGLIHVFNQQFLDDPENFLNVEVQSFEETRQPASLTGRDLLTLVRRTVSPPPPPPPGRRPGGIGFSQAVSVDEPLVTVTLKDATVRQALEALTREADNEIWVVTFLDSPQVTPTGFRRTKTLWNSFPIPDSAQPVWDFFRWGRAIPPPKLATSKQ